MRKKIMAIVLTAAMILSVPMAAYASEVQDTEQEAQEQELGTMDTASACTVTVSLLDGDGGYAGGPVTISLTDVTGTQKATIRDLAVGSTASVTVAAPTTYSAAFSGLADGYYVMDADGGTNISFAATANGNVALSLTVTKTGTVATQDDAGTEDAGTYSLGAFVFDGPADGVEVFVDFINATLPMQDESDVWDSTLYRLYNIYASRYAGWMESYLSGATADDWGAMSDYEHFVLAGSYLTYAGYLGYGDYDFYYGAMSSFHSYVTSSSTTLIEQTDSENAEAVLDAYLAMADWQYAYVEENGEPYNFIGDVDNMRALFNEIVKSDPEAELAEDEEEQEWWHDFIDTGEHAEDDGIWDATMRSVSRNMIIILIAAGLGIALLVLYRRRKALNIDDDKESDASITRDN